jgi:hypothetical protein
MNKFKINQHVLFTWTFNSYPGIIRGYAEGYSEGDVYIVEFSPDIAAGRINRLRNISAYYLKNDESFQEKEVKVEKRQIIIKI